MRRRVARLWILWLVLVPVVATGCATNPLTGKRSLMLLNETDEIQLGQQAAPGMADELGGPYGDPVMKEYVQGVGRKVAAEATKAGGYAYPYTFDVLDTDAVNAFALPGGPIYITRGLLFEMADESQLAGVLAHEATHVAAQHSAQQISKAMGAEFILAVLSAASSKGGSGGSGAGTAGDLAKIVGGLISLKYSRDNETESDTYGVEFAYAAGYQPMGMVRVMEMFERMEQQAGGSGPEFLRTHPNPENRAANLLATIDKKWPGATTDPRLAVGREAYQEHVLSRRNLVGTYSKTKKQ